MRNDLAAQALAAQAHMWPPVNPSAAQIHGASSLSAYLDDVEPLPNHPQCLEDMTRRCLRGAEWTTFTTKEAVRVVQAMLCIDKLSPLQTQVIHDACFAEKLRAEQKIQLNEAEAKLIPQTAARRLSGTILGGQPKTTQAPAPPKTPDHHAGSSTDFAPKRPAAGAAAPKPSSISLQPPAAPKSIQPIPKPKPHAVPKAKPKAAYPMQVAGPQVDELIDLGVRVLPANRGKWPPPSPWQQGHHFLQPAHCLNQANTGRPKLHYTFAPLRAKESPPDHDQRPWKNFGPGK